MRVLHLLASGGTGGIEILCKNIAYSSATDNRFVTLFFEGEIYEELKKANIKIFSVSSLNMKNKVKEINKYCTNENIDIIVLHHGSFKCNIIYYLLKKNKPKLKYIRYMHACFDQYAFGNSQNKLKNLLIRVAMQKAIDISDKIIYISKAVKKTFEDNFKIENDKGLIIYNGISEEFFIDPINQIKNNENFNLIFVGRLEKVKGVNFIIDAFSKMENQIKNVTLTFVGDGEERNVLEEQVKKLNLEEKIKFIGRQKNVIEWLDKSDIFLYPSIWEEGFGISVVEAMARGCIPIVSNRGGLPEIIEDGKNGFIFKYDDVEEFTQKIINIINSSNKVKEAVIKNAINRSEKFKISNTIKCLNEVYDGLKK